MGVKDRKCNLHARQQRRVGLSAVYKHQDEETTTVQPMSQSTHISPFSALPVEVVRLILEFAGRADTSSASHLVVVSHAVHDWILPILYETITISNPDQCMLLHRKLSSSSILAQCVKNISIRIHEGDSLLTPKCSLFQFALVSILQACQNLSNLSFTLSLDRLYRAASSYPVSLPFPTLPAQQLSHLHCASWDAWLYFSQCPHLYTSITHLRVDTPYQPGLGDSWHLSEILPNLTHLALTFDSRSLPSQSSDLTSLIKCLLRRERLKSLVILGSFCWDSAKFVNALSGIRDPRVTLLTFSCSLDEETCFKEWNAAARGEKGVWDRALQNGISVTIP